MGNISKPLIIIGSGPAGLTASIYSSRAKIEHIVICGDNKGGSIINSLEIENFPGFKLISGFDLMTKIKEHAESFGNILINDTIKNVNFHTYPFILNGITNKYTANSVIIATGSKYRTLNLPNEIELLGKGISYCAVCDGMFFKNKEVAVVGGGNKAIEEALYLENIVKKVTLIHRKDTLKADQILQDKLFKLPNIEILWNNVVKNIHTDKDNLIGIDIHNTKNNMEKYLNIDGLFISIGVIPNTEFLDNQLELDSYKHIITKGNSSQTSIKGIFAAGDVQEPNHKQAIISSGSGALASLEASEFLLNKEINN